MIHLLLTGVAMLAFAANSLLARAALQGGGVDAFSFTAMRLFAGAAVLGFLLWRQGGFRPGRSMPGSWVSASALLGYSLGFSLAYLRLGAATGAVILFASVQTSMIGWGLLRGHRPSMQEILGLVIAGGAFVWLMAPGVQAPDPAGAAAMVIAGISWGVVSLRGGGRGTAMEGSSGNFLRASALILPILAMAAVLGALREPQARAVGLALFSGGVTSGLGYALWYRVLPHLTPLQAASVQLTVPVIAALGAVAVLGEMLSLRLVLAGGLILGGVALTVLGRRRG